MNEPLPKPQAQVGDLNTAPETTAAQDLVQAGQRRINLVWEFTQTFIAGAVVTTILYVAAKMVLAAIGHDATEKQVAFANLAFVFLTGVANLVIGFYFGRTNHQRIGGVSQQQTR